jgi:hypothetical protein
MQLVYTSELHYDVEVFRHAVCMIELETVINKQPPECIVDIQILLKASILICIHEVWSFGWCKGFVVDAPISCTESLASASLKCQCHNFLNTGGEEFEAVQN